jgi:hypothetical protein
VTASAPAAGATDLGELKTWGLIGHSNAERLRTVTQISVGENHAVAILSNGATAAWGDNTYGQCLVPYGLGLCTRVEAGGRHTLVRRSTGALAAWGDNTYGQLNIPPAIGRSPTSRPGSRTTSSRARTAPSPAGAGAASARRRHLRD